MRSLPLWGIGFSASEIGDPEGTRTVIAIIALLVVMGLGLIMVAFWMRRTTRPDPDFLAPLELMGERSWRKGDPVWQRRRLDEVRPARAAPLQRSSAPPVVDDAFDAGPSASGFDDLTGDAPSGDVPLVFDAAPVDVEPAGATTPPETPAVRREPAGEPTDVERPPKPPVVALDEENGREPDGEAGDAPDRETVDLDDSDDERGNDPTPTPIASERLLDVLPDHEIDPVELERAMVELDAELQRRRGDE